MLEAAHAYQCPTVALASSGSKQLASVSWGPDQSYTFGLGADGHIYHHWYNGKSWTLEQLPGTGCYSAPEVVSWGKSNIDLFAIGRNNSCHHANWNGVR